jgi:hypothetical protein
MEVFWTTVMVVLFVALLIVMRFNKEPAMLTELKLRYWAILDVLRQTGDPMWKPLLDPAIITGIHGKKDGVIGSNVNKGYEIYICLDGNDVNSAVYVLIHELAHMSVPEYDHSSTYWENFKKLKDLCIQRGLYVRSGDRRYCGDLIKDS